MMYLIWIYFAITIGLFLLGIFHLNYSFKLVDDILELLYWLLVCFMWPVTVIAVLIDIYKEDHS